MPQGATDGQSSDECPHQHGGIASSPKSSTGPASRFLTWTPPRLELVNDNKGRARATIQPHDKHRCLLARRLTEEKRY